MKIAKLIITSVLAVTTIGCSVLPLDKEIQANHFRLENLIEDDGSKVTKVYSTCFAKKPTFFISGRQYEAGHHNIWVTSLSQKRNVPANTRAAYAHFEADFEPGKDYRIAQNTVAGEVSIWIEEIQTGNRVTPVVTATLTTAMARDHQIRRSRCKNVTV